MKNIEEVFKKIAKEHHTSVENVREEIAFSIETAMKNASPNAKKILKSMSETGITPTPEELIIYISNNLTNQ